MFDEPAVTTYKDNDWASTPFVKRLATKGEIERYLIKEAKRRGFKEGVKFNSLINTGKYVHSGKYAYHYDTGATSWKECLTDGSNSFMYADGIWADIIKGGKIEIGGYEVKFCGDVLPKGKSEGSYTTIDGHTFPKSFWTAAKVVSEHSKAKVAVGCSKQFDVSIDVINQILNNLETKD